MSEPRAPDAARSAPTAERLGPWAGLVAGPVAWLVHHQAGSDLVYWRCRLGSPWLTAGIGIACLALALAGAAWSWRTSRAAGHPRAFVGAVAAGAALLFALTIVAQAVPGLFYVGCQR